MGRDQPVPETESWPRKGTYMVLRIVWIVVGGLVGLVSGGIVGFGVALAVMSRGPARTDGGYGMVEMIVCLPLGALFGLLTGVAWGVWRAPA